MTEETHNAAISGPIGIINEIGVTAILSWFLNFSLLFTRHGSRLQDDGRIAYGSASNAHLPGHGQEEGRSCSDGE